MLIHYIIKQLHWYPALLGRNGFRAIKLFSMIIMNDMIPDTQYLCLVSMMHNIYVWYR